ncbi:hypothetical protein AHAS_Ahas02G0217000 [Arachis hypogaea]
MEEIAMIQKRFGDEQSTLLDQFERLSFEAMLRRSLSEPGLPRSLSSSVSHPSSSSKFFSVAPTTSIPLVTHQVKQGHGHGRSRGRGHGSAFHRVLKKLMKPFIFGSKKNHNKHAPDPKNPMSWKEFSRSLRLIVK